MTHTQAMLADIWRALGGPDGLPERVAQKGRGSLDSSFAISDFAAAATAAAGLALAEFIQTRGGDLPSVEADRRLASMWFAKSIRPVGWILKDPWDPIAGNYAARDGWIRLHTNATHHRAAPLSMLCAAADRDAVAKAVPRWYAQALEDAVVGAKGCAGVMRSLDEWRAHPQ